MKNILLLNKINEFIGEFYPEVSGVLLFGSASMKEKKHRDIDLLIVDEKFSYPSKSNIQFQDENFSVIKVSYNDVFNVLAEDYKNGIYKNIFETGFIIKDDIKFLVFTKQYLTKNHPDDKHVISFNLNKCVFKINEIVTVFEKKLPLIESFSNFSNLISLIIDYIILQDGKISFLTAKHKSKYLHQFHLKEALEINNILNAYKNNSKDLLLRIKKLIKKLNIPNTKDYYNDYLIENVNSLDYLVLFIPDLHNKNQLDELNNYFINSNILFHLYWIDKNNVEETGYYYIIEKVNKESYLKIREKIKFYLEEIVFFFPYNLSFNQEIKYGGTLNYKKIEILLFKIESILNPIRNNIKLQIPFVYFVAKKINVNIEEIYAFYFYKILNRNHNFSIKDLIHKERGIKMSANSLNNKTKLLDNTKFEIDYDFHLLSEIPKFFLIQIFDRILSMIFLSDMEKKQIIQSIKEQYIKDV